MKRRWKLLVVVTGILLIGFFLVHLRAGRLNSGRYGSNGGGPANGPNGGETNSGTNVAGSNSGRTIKSASSAGSQSGAITGVPAIDDSQISASALLEMEALVQEKASFTPAQRKLDSQIVFALKRNRNEPIANGKVPQLQIGLEPDVAGMILV